MTIKRGVLARVDPCKPVRAKWRDDIQRKVEHYFVLGYPTEEICNRLCIPEKIIESRLEQVYTQYRDASGRINEEWVKIQKLKLLKRVLNQENTIQDRINLMLESKLFPAKEYGALQGAIRLEYGILRDLAKDYHATASVTGAEAANPVTRAQKVEESKKRFQEAREVVEKQPVQVLTPELMLNLRQAIKTDTVFQDDDED